jgi:hypothetical protein
MSRQKIQPDIAKTAEISDDGALMPKPGKWVQDVKGEANPKLTFEAFEKAKAAAGAYITEEICEDARIMYHFNPSVQRGFGETINELLLGKEVVTLADANAVIDKRIAEFKGYARSTRNNIANASRINVTINAIRTFREALSAAMEVAPARGGAKS